MTNISAGINGFNGPVKDENKEKAPLIASLNKTKIENPTVANVPKYL